MPGGMPSSTQWAIVREAALRELRAHNSPVVRGAAEDLAQEVVIEYADAAACQTIEHPRAWAKLVARRRAVDLLRRTRSVGDVEDDEGQALRFFLHQGIRTSREALLLEQVDQLLAALSDRERQLVRMVADGESQADIASALGYASAAVVRTTLHRLRRRIMEHADQLGIDQDWEDHPQPYGDAGLRGPDGGGRG